MRNAERQRLNVLADWVEECGDGEPFTAAREMLAVVFPEHVAEVTEIILSDSLNAARTIAAAVLPEGEWTRSVDATVPETGIEVQLHPATGHRPLVKGDCKVEALAWLAAILRALASP